MSDSGGKRRSTDYKQVTGYVRRQLAVKFKTMCAAEEKEISQVLEELIEQWTTSKEKQAPTQDDHDDLARFVRKLALGTRPTDEDCIFAAHESGIETELALRLRDQIFTKPKNGINH